MNSSPSETKEVEARAIQGGAVDVVTSHTRIKIVEGIGAYLVRNGAQDRNELMGSEAPRPQAGACEARSGQGIP